LVEKGCYLQLTARSLNGGFGPVAKTTGDRILKRRVAHLIATDAHGSMKRRPGLASTLAEVRDAYGESVARTLLVDNPAAVLKSAGIRSMPAACNWFRSLFSKSPNADRNTAHP
jgi:protein-tyrosine phosphatase